MMGAIGTGNVKPGIVTASFGTSGTIYACSPRPVVDPRGEIAAFCSSTGAWLPLLCTMNVTTVTERVRALFGMDHAAMDAAASSVRAGLGFARTAARLEAQRLDFGHGLAAAAIKRTGAGELQRVGAALDPRPAQGGPSPRCTSVAISGSV